MDVRSFVTLAPASWAELHRVLWRDYADEAGCIVQVSRGSGLRTQSRWYCCGGGEVHHLAGLALFCCACGSVKTESEVFWELSARRRVWRWCRTCNTEILFVFELRPGIEHHLERFDKSARITWRDSSGHSFFDVA